MADEDEKAEDETEAEGDDENEDGDEEDGGGKKKLSGKTIVLFVVLPLLLLGGGGAAAFFLGVFDSAPPMEENVETAAIVPEKPKFYYDLPEILVNLNSRKRSSQFLKLHVSLEISNKEVSETLEPQLPRILDTFQIYLRELRSEDLEGSAGVYRLKEELLRRINLAITPQRVDRILFKEIIVQ